MLDENIFADPYKYTSVPLMHIKYDLSKLYIRDLDSTFCHKPFSRQKYNVSF